MEKDTMESTKDWDRLIEDGDWAVHKCWDDWSGDDYDLITPERIQHFLAWLLRRGPNEYIDWEDENPPRISKSSLPKMGVDGAGLKMISKLEKEKK